MKSRVRSRLPRFQSSAGAIAGALFLLGSLVGWSSPSTATTLEEEVVEAVEALYIHGLTEEIALEKVGRKGVPVLIKLLADAKCRNRDNVVIFLGHLGRNNAARALVAFLQNPPAPVTIPEEDRALLHAPQALGQIAARGEHGALQALMAMTAPGAAGGILAEAAEGAPDPDSLRDDLLEMALRGVHGELLITPRGSSNILRRQE